MEEFVPWQCGNMKFFQGKFFGKGPAMEGGFYTMSCHYFITRCYKFCVEHLKLERDELDVSFPRFWISVNFADATGSVLEDNDWMIGSPGMPRFTGKTKDSQILGQTAPIFSAGFARIFLKAPSHCFMH